MVELTTIVMKDPDVLKVLILGALLFASGCATSDVQDLVYGPQRHELARIKNMDLKRGVYMTRLQDINPQAPPRFRTALAGGMTAAQAAMLRRPPRRDLFGRGEVPTAIVYGFSGETVTLEILNLLDGLSVFKDTSYIPDGQDWFIQIQNLADGSFKATLKVSGTLTHSVDFAIQR